MRTHPVVNGQQTFALPIDTGPATQQGLGIGILRTAEQSANRACFTHTTFAHHHGMIGHFTHQT